MKKTPDYALCAIWPMLVVNWAMAIPVLAMTTLSPFARAMLLAHLKTKN